MTLTLTLLTGLLVIVAGGAQAQTGGLTPYALAPHALAPKAPMMSLARDVAAFQVAKSAAVVPLRYAHAPLILPRGIAKTSVESRLAGDGPVASAGLLCGLKPSADDSGIGTARGYDNDGRFVGAKLAFRF